MPEVDDDAASATLTAWLVGESGDFVGAQSIATVETDTTLLSIEVAEPGFLIRSLVEPGQHVAPGTPLAVLGAPGEVIEDVEQLIVQLGIAVSPESQQAQDAGAHLRAVPADDPLRATTWPPPEPALTRESVETVEPVESIETSDPESVMSLVEAASADALDEPIVVRRVVGWADTVAEAVVDTVLVGDPRAAEKAATSATSQVQLRDVVRADGLLAIVSGVDSVSLIALVVKAVAVAGRQMPLRPGSSAIADVAVQRWTPSGTVAPVVHVANLMTVSSLTTTLGDLDTRAREGRLAAGELEPASVTVVDLGTEGIAEGTVDATAAHPAVLTIGAVRVQPVVEGGVLVPGRVLAISFSCDTERIEPGAAARWMAHLAGLLEEPLRFLA
jgi:pyruvate dehydrogenase E2 component (dihydrolipoamide acetyltransferase)